MTQSRWAKWSKGVRTHIMFEEFLYAAYKTYFIEEVPTSQIDTGNPTSPASGITPAQKAQQMGLISNGHGAYLDPNTNEVVARTVNGELVFYDGGPGGGAISDGSGGEQLTTAQPSWRDPASGLIIVPPATPESDAERRAVPEPTPASAPKGFNEYMADAKRQANQEQEKELQTQQQVADIEMKIAEIPILNDYFNEQNDGDPVWVKATSLITDNIGEYADSFEKTEERFHEDILDGAVQLAQKDFEIEESQENLMKLQDSPAYLQMRDKDKQMALEMAEEKLEEMSREKEQLEESIRVNNMRVKAISSINRKLETVAKDPTYDLHTKKGAFLGDGSYGTVNIVGDGNVIKEGRLSQEEIYILSDLHDTGVVPEVINAYCEDMTMTDDFFNGKLGMSRAPGKTFTEQFVGLDQNIQDMAHTNFVRARSKIHLSGVAHNDMHADNVMITDDAQTVTIIDFGFAQKSKAAAYMEAMALVSGEDYDEDFGELEDSSIMELLKRNADDVREYFNAMLDTVSDGLSDDDDLMRDLQRGGFRVNVEDYENIPEEMFETATKMLYDGVDEL